MKVVLIGYSGHGKVVTDAALKCNIEIKKYLDYDIKEDNPFDLEYFGNNDDLILKKLINQEYRFIIGIGNNQIRHKIYNQVNKLGGVFCKIIHPGSFLSEKCKVGLGSFISSNVSVNVSAEILENCIINTSAIIEHDCLIKSSVHVAPGAVLCGNVTVGEKSFIGANSTIKQGVKIGNNVLIGAGSLVLSDIPDNTKCFGNPVKYE